MTVDVTNALGSVVTVTLGDAPYSFTWQAVNQTWASWTATQAANTTWSDVRDA